MQATATAQSPQRVLLLEPNPDVRWIIQTLLSRDKYLVEQCTSLEPLLVRSDQSPNIALVAWQSMQGLLADEHRHDLAELTKRVRLVLMVPRSWARLLETTDLAQSARLLPKPFEPTELFDVLEKALAPQAEAGRLG